MNCELCEQAGGDIIWQDDRLRVVAVADPHYPAYYRLIWQAHVKEMTDLPRADRDWLMRAVFAVEAAIRAVARPDKINIASLGNMVQHVHVHVIGRWTEDRHFPNAVWGEVRRPDAVPAVVDQVRLAAVIRQALDALQATGG